jgi:hypothetical protein
MLAGQLALTVAAVFAGAAICIRTTAGCRSTTNSPSGWLVECA